MIDLQHEVITLANSLNRDNPFGAAVKAWVKPVLLLQMIVLEPATQTAKLHFDRAELAGAVADLGVLIPIAVALIIKNGLSPTAVLLPAALLYVAAGLIYRLPVPVQPLKAFSAIAIARGFGSTEIAAGSLLMGAIFVAFGVSGLLDRIAKLFPLPIIRGVQPLHISQHGTFQFRECSYHDVPSNSL